MHKMFWHTTLLVAWFLGTGNATTYWQESSENYPNAFMNGISNWVCEVIWSTQQEKINQWYFCDIYHHVLKLLNDYSISWYVNDYNKNLSTDEIVIYNNLKIDINTLLLEIPIDPSNFMLRLNSIFIDKMRKNISHTNIDDYWVYFENAIDSIYNDIEFIKWEWLDVTVLRKELRELIYKKIRKIERDSINSIISLGVSYEENRKKSLLNFLREKKL